MGKIIQFKNKPKPLSYGQYYYDNDDNIMEQVEDSAGIKKPYNKFSNQTLQTTVVSDEVRDLIIQKKYKFIGISNIKINKLKIKNAGVNHKVKNTHFRGFVFDKNTFDCFSASNSNELKSYSDISNALYKNITGDTIPHPFEGLNLPDIHVKNETRLYDHAMFFNWNAPTYKKKKGPGELDFLTNQIILQNFNATTEASNILEVPEIKHSGTLSDGMSNFSASAWGNQSSDRVPIQPFNPMDGLGLMDISERQTSIFSEDGQNNYLQFVIWTKGNARRIVGTKKRRKRLYVFKVNIGDLFDFDSNGNPSGKSNSITFENYRNVSGGGGSTPAFKVTDFSITVNTYPGVSIDEFPDALNNPYNLDILESVETPLPIRLNSFDEDFINVGIFTQPKYYSDGLLAAGTYGNDFTPMALVTIKDKLNQNLQSYKIDDLDRQICSAPTQVEFKLNITTSEPEDSILVKKYPHNSSIPLYYKFCVVDWNDKDDKIKTVKDALDLKPLDFNQILKKQNNNTFIFEDIDNTLLNSYSTPGIKQIKVLVFSYNEYGNVNPNLGASYNYQYLPSDNKNFLRIEPLRYKLMTVRIFLDIPVNQFPDFGEIGGTDYKTIPWPYTTPIINGVSDDSKYNKSINDVLGSGKIGNTDIIDEIFLYQARENDELGKTIDQMDLEQVRYFNTGSYNMNTLLGVNPITNDGFRPYNYINYVNEPPNEIEDVLFESINHNNSGISNQWFGELESSGNRTGTDLYEQEQYDDNSKGIHIKYTATNITGDTWTFFRYQRKDLHNSLKTFEEGGTEYTFKFEIKFNQFSPNAPSFYMFRTANRDNDYGTAFHNTDGFQMNNNYFYHGNDGIYSNSGLTNKLGDYGEWITIERTRKLISDYSSTRHDNLVEIDGFPNMEFLTQNWDNTWNNASEAILDFDIRNPIMLPTKIWEASPFYWDGETNKFSEETSVGQIFIGDNSDLDLKQSCKLELNTGELTGKSIYDSSGNSNKGLLIGDYKVKKVRKGEPMRRDSFIKVPNKKNNINGAL